MAKLHGTNIHPYDISKAVEWHQAELWQVLADAYRDKVFLTESAAVHAAKVLNGLVPGDVKAYAHRYGTGWSVSLRKS